MVELCGWHSTINIGHFTIANHFSIQYECIEVRRTITKTQQQSTSQRLFRQVSNVVTFILAPIKNESAGTSISVICRICKIQPARNVPAVMATVAATATWLLSSYHSQKRIAAGAVKENVCLSSHLFCARVKWIEWKASFARFPSERWRQWRHTLWVRVEFSGCGFRNLVYVRF